MVQMGVWGDFELLSEKQSIPAGRLSVMTGALVSSLISRGNFPMALASAWMTINVEVRARRCRQGSGKAASLALSASYACSYYGPF